MDESEIPAPGHKADQDTALSSRRRLLQLGAVAATTVITVRPALAQTAASVLNCEIPVPDPHRAGQWIAADGSLVAPGTQGAFQPPLAPLKGEDVRAALAGRNLPGTSFEQNQAYVNYVRRLQHGMSGFTCYASLQMPH
jgi:hypothetical protein